MWLAREIEWRGGALAARAGLLLTIGLVLLPLATVLWLALQPADGSLSHLASTVLPRSTRITLGLLIGVGIFTIVVAVRRQVGS